MLADVSYEGPIAANSTHSISVGAVDNSIAIQSSDKSAGAEQLDAAESAIADLERAAVVFGIGARYFKELNVEYPYAHWNGA